VLLAAFRIAGQQGRPCCRGLRELEVGNHRSVKTVVSMRASRSQRSGMTSADSARDCPSPTLDDGLDCGSKLTELARDFMTLPTVHYLGVCQLTITPLVFCTG